MFASNCVHSVPVNHLSTHNHHSFSHSKSAGHFYYYYFSFKIKFSGESGTKSQHDRYYLVTRTVAYTEVRRHLFIVGEHSGSRETIYV